MAENTSVELDKPYYIPLSFQDSALHFGLGQIVDFKDLAGNTNANYSVTVEDGRKFIFKTLLKHSLADFQTECIFLNRLREHNFPAAYYIEDTEGVATFQSGSDLIVVQPQLEGKHPGFTPEVCRSIGKNIAALHLIPSDGLPERDHWLRESFLPANIELIQVHLPEKAEPYNKAFDSVRGFKYSSLPQTIVHGDLYESNCLYD